MVRSIFFRYSCPLSICRRRYRHRSASIPTTANTAASSITSTSSSSYRFLAEDAPQGRRDFFAMVVLSAIPHVAAVARLSQTRLSTLLAKLQAVAESHSKVRPSSHARPCSIESPSLQDADRCVEIFHLDEARPYLPWLVSATRAFFDSEFVSKLSFIALSYFHVQSLPCSLFLLPSHPLKFSSLFPQ